MVLDHQGKGIGQTSYLWFVPQLTSNAWEPTRLRAADTETEIKANIQTRVTKSLWSPQLRQRARNHV